MTQPLEYEVVLYPDPILRKVSEPVASFDSSLREMVAAMFARMHKSKGVGLAAPQVGLRRRVLVLNPTGEDADALALINPTITARAGERVLFDEGCLSFPGIYAEISRPDRCIVQAYDLDGVPFEKEYDGFVSRIIQHEHDHLEGVLLVDRMSPAERQKHKPALESLVDRYQRGRRSTAPARPS